jgi:hypothetical protein
VERVSVDEWDREGFSHVISDSRFTAMESVSVSRQ